jgi:hypothetical protein
MDSERQRRLEADVDRELKRLPDLTAPATLAPRVLVAIAHRASVPWYRQAWQMWPMPLRAASLLLGLALMGALGWGLGVLPQTPGAVLAVNHVAGWFSWLSAIWNVLNVILSALVLAAKQLGTAFFVAVLLLLAIAWAMCVGLGTVYVRLALARR